MQHISLYASTITVSYLKKLLKRNRIMCRRKLQKRLGFAGFKRKEGNKHRAPKQLLITETTQHHFFLEQNQTLLSTQS